MASRPARGAWVEITKITSTCKMYMSRPARGAWVEIIWVLFLLLSMKSRPARGAWVEMNPNPATKTDMISVAPRKGRVG